MCPECGADLRGYIHEDEHPDYESDYHEDDDKSDVMNLLASMNHGKKNKRSQNTLDFLEFIAPVLLDKGLKIIEFSTNSFRITDEVKQVDYYPSSKKCFLKYKDNKWIELKKFNTTGVLNKLLDYLI